MAELKVKVTADTRGFTQGMNFTKQEVQAWNRVLQQGAADSAEKMKASFESVFAGVTTAAVAAGIAIKSSLDFGSHIQDASERTGLSPEFLQKVQLEAKNAGADIGTVVGFVEKLAKTSQEALGGDKELEEVYKRMGLSLENLEDNSLEETFKKVREHMKATSLDAELIADTLKVGGKGAGQLIPMLRGKEQGDRGVSGAEDISKLDALGDKLNEVGAHFAKQIRSAVTATVFPIMDFMSFGRLGKESKIDPGEKDKERDAIAKGSARADLADKKKAAEEEKIALKEREQTAKRIAELEKDVHKSQREYQFGALKTNEEKIAFLEKEKEAMTGVMNDLNPNNRENQLKAQADVNRTQKEIDKLKQDDEDKWLEDIFGGTKEKSKKLGKGNDQLLSVGNFLGAGSSETDRRLDKMADHLQAIRENTKGSNMPDPYK
jgi:hypothetical protein